MSGDPLQQASLEDHQKAFTEVAFLVDIFTSTIDNIMGGATAPVGRIAGRETARKLPVDLHNPTIEQAVEMLAERMGAGFGFTLDSSGADREMVFDRCVLRDVCTLRGVATGSALCRLFHSYFDGIVNELICRPVKSEIISSGEQCRTAIRMQ